MVLLKLFQVIKVRLFVVWKRVRRKLKRDSKSAVGLNFWKREIENYLKWFNGELKLHYLTPSPSDDQKVKAACVEHGAMLTWLKLHQEPKYLDDLMLDKMAFSGLRILDIGSGPLPSAQAFEDCEIYCLDPLLPEYAKLGYPSCYGDRVKFTSGFSEKMPLKDNFFDAVISVNAIDHVDDIYKTALEIKRVLKPDGKIRIHAHYHKKTTTEPLELNDKVMGRAFNWCKNFRRVKESTTKRGSVAPNGEIYVLWSNFE